MELYEAKKEDAESLMASWASRYAQLLGHQNGKQKIHHLEKLKEDIVNLRKELAEKNFALEKEKRAKLRLEAKLEEVLRAFQVAETPAILVTQHADASNKNTPISSRDLAHVSVGKLGGQKTMRERSSSPLARTPLQSGQVNPRLPLS